MRGPLVVLGTLATTWTALLWIMTDAEPTAEWNGTIGVRTLAASPVGWALVHLSVVGVLSLLAGAVVARLPGVQPSVRLPVCAPCAASVSLRAALTTLAALAAPLCAALLFLSHPLAPLLPPVPLAAALAVALGGLLAAELLEPVLVARLERVGRAWVRVAASAAPQWSVDAPPPGPGVRSLLGAAASVLAVAGCAWVMLYVPFPDGCLAGARRVDHGDHRSRDQFACELPDGSAHGLSRRVFGNPRFATWRMDRLNLGVWERSVDADGVVAAFMEFDGDHERDVWLREDGSIRTESNRTRRELDGLQLGADPEGARLFRYMARAGTFHGPFEAWCRVGGDHWRCVEGGFEDGLGQGRWRWFHPSGAVAMAAEYARGHKVGPWVFVDEAGNERCRGSYEPGVLPPRNDPFVQCLWKEHHRFQPWLHQVATLEAFHMAGVGSDFGPGVGP